MLFVKYKPVFYSSACNLTETNHKLFLAKSPLILSYISNTIICILAYFGLCYRASKFLEASVIERGFSKKTVYPLSKTSCPLVHLSLLKSNQLGKNSLELQKRERENLKKKNT